MASKPTWLEGRADFLCEYLVRRHSLVVAPPTLVADLSDQLDKLANDLGITRRTAQQYLTDDYVRGFGDLIAERVREAWHPGR
ncbi:Uncharacterised protein [Mycobacteroides abscessus subsp. massiliense]|uniref:hypothetical protein n=1 Tax=Mycobacteroides abscessus TaxID=36809 RepID=UPI0009CE8DC4|nr:hypothetical protein [Mycobacteroides abscessus]SKM80346.1 Uncharacterised protein [Mycobacteroides abscessus subsp. massiliense]SKM96670.1 Uncharacterised protein [Mycobacteroides abscessus subsp. massiliense]SKN75746.1 Uncharacterised protein [Mycobacteroides abscessus subsp. massiliense]SKN97629.1 Uncharacterised protein [Mycobacteroides abscessus subsp. massiliense]SKO20364.1 Uncharacterised protein [Mycobacteroides abscessus subsp. massiliense]